MDNNENNALTAGITHDGIKNRTDIKILICGLISRADEPLTPPDITGIVSGSSVVNYFELCSAIDELCAAEVITVDGSGYLDLTDEGRNAAAQLWEDLPLTVREKTAAALESLCALRRSERENGFLVEDTENGCRVECIVNNGSEQLMSVTLTLPDRSYAKKVRKRFYSDPERLYRLVLFQLTGDDRLAPKD